jgi:hypothetical protein
MVKLKQGHERGTDMNKIQLITSILMIWLLGATVAFGRGWIPEKYNLDDRLTRVDGMPNTNIMGWETIDNQSLVIQTSPKRFYLIVLSSPAYELPFTETIGVTGLNLSVRPGFDSVIVYGTVRTDRYIINRIYKLENRVQVREIEARLTGKMDKQEQEGVRKDRPSPRMSVAKIKIES